MRHEDRVFALFVDANPAPASTRLRDPESAIDLRDHGGYDMQLREIRDVERPSPKRPKRRWLVPGAAAAAAVVALVAISVTVFSGGDDSPVADTPSSTVATTVPATTTTVEATTGPAPGVSLPAAIGHWLLTIPGQPGLNTHMIEFTADGQYTMRSYAGFTSTTSGGTTTSELILEEIIPDAGRFSIEDGVVQFVSASTAELSQGDVAFQGSLRCADGQTGSYQSEMVDATSWTLALIADECVWRGDIPVGITLTQAPDITAESVVGTWAILKTDPGPGLFVEFTNEGGYEIGSLVSGVKLVDDVGDFSITDGALAFVSRGGSKWCEEGESGSYAVRPVGDGQTWTMTVIADTCAIRGDLPGTLFLQETP